MKSIFPVSYSTLDPDALGLFIAAAYGLNRCDCSLLLRGVSDTYLIRTDGDKFIFRVYRAGFRTVTDVQTETRLLHTLHKQRVSVSHPIKNLDGSYINGINAAEGERLGVLFTFAHGRSYQQLNDSQLTSLGVEMARFHNVSSIFEISRDARHINTTTTLFDPIRKVEPYFKTDPESYAWLKQSAEEVANRISKTDTSAFSSGYCQFDFLPKNFHFDESDKVTLFDFDFLGYGWLVNDIMSFWIHLNLDVFFNRITPEAGKQNFETFVSAYRTQRVVTEDELGLIPWLSLGFWVFYMGFHVTHDQFYGMVKEPGQLKLRMGLIRKFTEANWNLVR